MAHDCPEGSMVTALDSYQFGAGLNPGSGT